MPLYPDLHACGITSLRFSIHLPGGLEDVEAFWERRGVDRSRERLLFSSYSRNHEQHSVWLRWARSHAECCDVWLGLDIGKPKTLWSGRRIAEQRLREGDLRAFLDFIRDKEPLWIKAEYVFPWDRSLDSMIHLPPQVRAKSLSLEVFDDKDRRRVMNVTYERRGKGWFAVVVPAGRFRFSSEPISDTFFRIQYDTACLLAKSLRQARLEPL